MRLQTSLFPGWMVFLLIGFARPRPIRLLRSGILACRCCVRLPGSYLHQGTNTITLQAIEERAQAVPDAGLTYDAIGLNRAAISVRGPASSAEILPTIFYRQRQGQLDEIVDVLVRHEKRINVGNSVELILTGKHYRQPLVETEDLARKS